MTAVKERPLILYPHEVTAVLERRMSQIRRPIKPQPDDHHWKALPGYRHKMVVKRTSDGCAVRSSHTWKDRYHAEDGVQWMRCPFGKPGDRLWVRETWASIFVTYDFETGACDWITEILPDQVKAYRDRNSFDSFWKPSCVIEYRADGNFDGYAPEEMDFRWRPSIHLPRWACRIVLEVTDVRAERIQEMTDEDAIAEGVQWTEDGPLHGHHLCPETAGAWHNTATPREGFACLWDSIYAKQGLGFDTDPWVWVGGFKVIEGEVTP